jgi:hypothetical protein
MDWSASVTKRYRNRIAVLSFVALIIIATAAVCWPLFSSFEANRAGYISGVLSWGKGCGAKISPPARERLKYFQQGDAASFTAGFALGRKQLLEQMRDAAGYANTCRLFVDRYARVSETALLIAFPSDLTEFEWPFWLIVLLTAWLLLRSLVSTLRQPRILPSSSTMKNWPRALSLLCLTVSTACVAAVALQFSRNGLLGGYYSADPRRETLLATVSLGFGPTATFAALYGLLRWVIRRGVSREPARNRLGHPLGNVVAQPRRVDARGAVSTRRNIGKPQRSW